MRTRLEMLRGDDGGWAMVAVLGTMTVLSLLVAVALSSASSALGTSRKGQDSQAALAAAQAGVQHYVEQLNRDDLYFRRTAPATPLAGDPGGIDPANAALRINVAVPPPSTRVARVSNGGAQSFRYQVLSSQAEITRTGQVALRSVGRSRDVERTVQVVLANESIFKYLYYTEFETPPPLVAGTDPALCTALSHDQHGTAARPMHPTCTDLAFGNGDDILGPLHSEDRLRVQSDLPSGSNGNQPPPRFRGTVETGWLDPSGRGYVALGPAAPRFDQGTPLHVDFPFPKYNTELREEVVERGNGCRYTGPTRVLFQSGGTMTVTSPGTLTASSACGTFSSFNGYTATVPVPNGGVVWVDRSTDEGCTMADQSSRLGFPVAGDDALLEGTAPLFHDCAAGTVFVEGWVKGRVTLGVEDNVFVTGNLRYVGAGGAALSRPVGTVTEDTSGSDALGLYAQSGYVAVYHPLDCTGRELDEIDNKMCRTGSDVSRAGTGSSTTAPSVPTTYPMTDVQIDAAIVAPRAFLVPNHTLGAPLGRLHVVGSIIQRFRGAVARTTNGVPSSGYRKNYYYDARLKSAPPPFLADASTTAWGVSQFAEGPG